MCSEIVFLLCTNYYNLKESTPLRTSVRSHTTGGSPGDVSEVPVIYVKRQKGYRMSYDVGEGTEWL